MKKLKASIAVLFALLFVNIAVASPEAAAEAALTRYFDALSQGNVITLRSLMAGELLTKRSPLLDNPTYPTFLINTYGNASFQINTVKSLSPSTVTINASIIFDQNDISQRQYLLRKDTSSNLTPSFRIYDDRRQEISNH